MYFLEILFPDDNVNASSSIPLNDYSSAEKLDQGVGLYDGRKRIIYWSDAISEIAFVVPSLKQPLLPNTTSKLICYFLRLKESSVLTFFVNMI